MYNAPSISSRKLSDVQLEVEQAEILEAQRAQAALALKRKKEAAGGGASSSKSSKQSSAAKSKQQQQHYPQQQQPNFYDTIDRVKQEPDYASAFGEPQPDDEFESGFVVFAERFDCLWFALTRSLET